MTESDPADVDALLAAGRHAEAAQAARAAGDPARAQKIYERIWDFAAAAACAEEAGDVAGALASWIDARRPDDARRVARTLCDAGPDGARRAAEIFARKRWLGEAAAVHARLGEHEQAAALYQRGNHLAEAARELEILGRPREAGQLLERFLERSEDPVARADAHHHLGQLLAGLGSHEDAVRHLQEATRGAAQPWHADALALMAKELGAQGLAAAAEAALARARALDPSRARPALPGAHRPLLTGDAPRDRLGGRYRLLELLGQGGAGRVYRAVDEVSGREVAIKVFAAAQTRGHDAYQRFVREAEMWRRGRHPNIVDVLDFREDQGFYVMELMAGTLSARLRPRLAARDVKRLALDLLSALAHAHARGVVHRDIKPANVFFDAAGTAKLGDFGAAHLADLGATQTGALIGTLAYMSPEQVTAAPISHAADLYALGVTLFQALTGRLPFVGPDFVAQHLGEPPPAATEVWAPSGAAWDSLLAALLAKDPAERPASAEAVAQAIRQMGSGGKLEVLILPRGPRSEPVETPVEAPVEPALPRENARYQGEVVLGETAVSVLVRAVDQALARSVVLERFRAGHPAGDAEARLRAAARAGAATLQRVLAWSSGQVVFEAPAGDPVGARRLTPRQVVTLLADVGRALESLHAQGAAHGAVAPERVLWDERATLALAGMPEVTGGPEDDARAALAVAAAALGAENLASGLADALGAETARAIAETPVERGADLIALADDLRVALVSAARRA